MAILRHHVYDLPLPPSRFFKGEYFPPAVDRLILRALAKDRGARPPSATDFARELENAYLQARSSAGAATARNPRVAVEGADAVTTPLNAETAAISSNALVPQSGAIARNDEGGRAARGKLRLVLAVLIACALLGWAGWRLRKGNPGTPNPPQPSPTPDAGGTSHAALTELLQYRVKLERPIGGLITPPPDLTVRSGESFFFQFRLMRAGALYLLEELKDGSWRWFNAAASGRQPINPAGKWVELPRGQYYTLDDEAGEERFLVIYVPEHLPWSLAEAVAPSRISVSTEKWRAGTALIEPEAVSRALARLNADGVELEAQGSQIGNAFEFRLRQPGEEPRAAYYRIKLNHVARR
jgi:hypothetical protein